MAGIDDVARAAGVSTATVSRALSGRGRISDATRARVRAAADELGYVVSASASSLASGRTHSIGVLVPLLDRWFFAQVLDGIASVLTPRGYDITLYNLTDDPAQRRAVLDTSLRRQRIDGLITVDVRLNADEAIAVAALEVPVVGLGASTPSLTTLAVDDMAVARLATQHLLDLGHRRIAHVGAVHAPAGATDVPSLRRQGFMDAVAAAGGEALFAQGDFTIESGYRAGVELLDASQRPSAIFAASDEMAFGALFAARERGLSVPEDISIVGVDGHEQSAFFDLTTVEQFPHAQGERAADAVLARLDGRTFASDLPVRLIARSSSGVF